ncbi:hypothetical protein STRIP9103_03192 [Streptomyces ipomoeae 91-03]|uniref:Uncharacterized protein n=1 Tax=Streptomyces ipomoeae 91-03 TaxID=698759 RepID=L1L5R2_9ACTN|nr:hypothetical protein STRIP9103_03192 [Streptomyces ipomoeae 91-03]
MTFLRRAGIFCVRSFLDVRGSLESVKQFPPATFGLPKKGTR